MKSFTLNRVIFSAGALFLGIILLIWPTGSLYFLAKFIGVFLAVGGVAAGVMYFQDHDSAMKSILLVLALVMLICGAVIFLHPEELIKLIPTILGMMIVVSGLINLGETFILSRSKYKKWWISLIIAVITIACGVFVINRALGLASLITRIAGGVLIFDGASHLWVTSRVYKSSKEAASTVEGSAVEVKPETNGAGAAPAGNSPVGAGGGNPAGTVGGAQEAGGAASAAASAAQAGPASGGMTSGPTREAANAVQEVGDIQKSSGHDNSEVPGSNENHAPDNNLPVAGQTEINVTDDTPEYMRQVEQETDFQLYASQNPVQNDDSGSRNSINPGNKEA